MGRAKMGDERREQILTAFEKCVVRDGLAKTTLQNVAAEAGLPRSLVRYFTGNRDDMVDLLIERMIERGQAQLEAMQPKGRQAKTEDLLGFLFGGVFADETSNCIVTELFYLSGHDESIKARLQKMYQGMQDVLSKQMAKDGIGKGPAERRALSYALMSLAYGDATFSFLGLKGGARNSLRSHAALLLEEAARKGRAQGRKQK